MDFFFFDNQNDRYLVGVLNSLCNHDFVYIYTYLKRKLRRRFTQPFDVSLEATVAPCFENFRLQTGLFKNSIA
jgi:hypothetical protein